MSIEDFDWERTESCVNMILNLILIYMCIFIEHPFHFIENL